MDGVNVRRLAAIDMYSARGATRRRRIVLAEFIAGAVVMVAFGVWLAAFSSGLAGRVLGLWMAGSGVNYVPLAAYAIALSRAGALDAELAGVDTGRELRRYSVLQLWIFVPLSLVVLAVAMHLAGAPNGPCGYRARNAQLTTVLGGPKRAGPGTPERRRPLVKRRGARTTTSDGSRRLIAPDRRIWAAHDGVGPRCWPRGSAGSGRCRSARGPVSLAAGQRGEHVREDGVGPGVQLVVGQQLDRMGNVDQAGARHAEPACLLDGFVGERCRGDADRRDAPAL